MTETGSSDTDTHRLVAQRKEKLQAWREQGAAFPNDFRPDALADAFARHFDLADFQ